MFWSDEFENQLASNEEVIDNLPGDCEEMTMWVAKQEYVDMVFMYQNGGISYEAMWSYHLRLMATLLH